MGYESEYIEEGEFIESVFSLSFFPIFFRFFFLSFFRPPLLCVCVSVCVWQ